MLELCAIRAPLARFGRWFECLQFFPAALLRVLSKNSGKLTCAPEANNPRERRTGSPGSRPAAQARLVVAVSSPRRSSLAYLICDLPHGPNRFVRQPTGFVGRKV